MNHLTFSLPERNGREQWLKELDTATGWPETEEFFQAEAQITVESRSLVVLRQVSEPTEPG